MKKSFKMIIILLIIIVIIVGGIIFINLNNNDKSQIIINPSGDTETMNVPLEDEKSDAGNSIQLCGKELEGTSYRTYFYTNEYVKDHTCHFSTECDGRCRVIKMVCDDCSMTIWELHNCEANSEHDIAYAGVAINPYPTADDNYEGQSITSSKYYLHHYAN